MAAKKKPAASEYAIENKQRQAEWEPGFRYRMEWIIEQLGGPGKVQNAAHIKGQTLLKMRKGGSRLYFLARLLEATGVDATWLLLGGPTPRKPKRGPAESLVDWVKFKPRNAPPRAQRTGRKRP